MKSLLAPLVRPDAVDAQLGAALSIARRFDGYIEGCYARPATPVFVGDAFGMGAAYAGDMTTEWLGKEAEAQSAFRAFMDGAGVPADGAPGGISAAWHGALDGPVRINEYSRLFDLVVIGRDPDDEGAAFAACEDALFEGGCPILLAPAAPPPDDFGGHILIAWNGSTETARTIALGMRLIERADKILVLTVEGATVPGPSGEQVAAALRRRGLTVDEKTVRTQQRSAGEAILAEAASAGADLVFKGAYTHSRLRQMVFGGPTRHIMASSSLPVFMAH
jgi:nucleotide-binding universal stress UspA family protein